MTLFPEITKEIEGIKKEAQDFFDNIDGFLPSNSVEAELYGLEELCKGCSKWSYENPCPIEADFLAGFKRKEIKLGKNTNLYCIKHSNFDLIQEYRNALKGQIA